MANLIPQKQVREVDNFRVDVNFEQNVNISGSLIVAEDLQIEGSLVVSQSFDMGSNPNETSSLTGSIEITGSLTIDGPLSFANAANRLDATASYADEALNTSLFDRFTSQDFQAQRPTLYVSSTAGNDNNDGRTLQYPLRTIKKAAEIAEAGYDGRYGFDTGSAFNGYVIKVQAGTYLENNPVILPSNTTIWGAGLRITKINAQNPEQDLFWVNSGCYVAEVTVGGLRLWPDQVNPERGFGFAFQPGAFITTSPYIQNCSQISNQENSFTELYEDIPPGGGGLYVNGDAVDPDSPLASMVLDAYTQISPNGVGCLVNGRGFIQLVSFFNNFSYYAIRVNNGGHATLNNSNISFGLFGMYASGSRKIPGSGGDRAAFQKVQDGWSVVVDVLNKGLDGLPEVKVLNTDAGIRATNFTQSFGNDSELNTKFGTTTAGSERAEEVWSDFTIVSNIVAEGPGNYPTLLAKSSTRGFNFNSPWNILGTPQITSSISAGEWELSQISSSIGTILGIFADGTGSYVFQNNTSASIRATELTADPLSPPAPTNLTGSISSSFSTIINIIENGLTAVPTRFTSSNAAGIISGEVEQYTSGISSSFETLQNVSASFSIIYNILANGTGSSILDIPQNHKFNFDVSKSIQDGAYLFEGIGNNPTITLFRGETYRFNLDAELGVPSEPFYIRTQPISGYDKDEIFNYNEGVINNGDSVGVITFTVPFDSPNKLYYISQDTPSYQGVFNIVNNSQTPKELIAGTITYPPTILSSSVASEDLDIINAYEVLTNNKEFIKEETIIFLSSSWSEVEYNQETCKRDIGFIVDAVAYDLLYGGNEESIRAGFFYYEYPSEATTTQLSPTTTAVKYISELSQKLVQNIQLQEYDIEKFNIAQNIFENKQFIKEEVIAYISSSWSEFSYNQETCKRDVGYILDAVRTDILYGGNERSIEAGKFYYLYPSQATTTQLFQTVDGVRYAFGLVQNLIEGRAFTTRENTTIVAVELLRANRSLIQDETIQFINVNYPQLSYNQTKCRRDVGYILDAIITDLLYGGNERSVIAGNFYYDFPSIATTTQKVETAGGIRYSRIIAEYIVQNIILETPRIITNDESLIRVTNLTNTTSSISGGDIEQLKISSSFNIVESIVRRGLSAIPAIVVKETQTDWGIYNPYNVTTLTQTTSSITSSLSDDLIEENWNVVTSIIEGGVGVIPPLTSSVDGLVKISSISQVSGTAATGSVSSSISSSFGLVGNIVTNGTGSLPTLVLNTQNNIQVGNVSLVGGTPATSAESASVSQSMGVIINILNNGLSVLPLFTSSLENNIKVGSVTQFTGSQTGSISDINFISSSISIVTRIIETGNLDLFQFQPYTTPSTASSTLAAYEILKENIDFIQEETIAYISSSWRDFEYDEEKCRRDVGLIISGAVEDLLWGANSASIVNGQFYYEYPSQATSTQLNQTLDGINYASRLAQKLVRNTLFVTQSDDRLNAASLLVDNKDFIKEETILYISSSWSTFNYSEVTCRRDVGYILDAVATDLIYGGNERTRIAGEYYFLYPSEATDTQLIQTTDAINYASRIAQKIVVGEAFTLVETNKVNASNRILQNQNLIAEEVIAYVSSSWSGVFYNQETCKRDVKYILDAVRTDLVYGGNERTITAGEFYYRFPSAATIGGVPSTTAQLDPTITGIFYAGNLTQQIILNRTLVSPSTELVEVARVVRENKARIQQNTIDFVADTYPQLVYDVARCYRDVGFIVDGVLTDIVYGGNERSITSGLFYYKFPSKATTSEQVIETVGALNFAKDLVKLIAVGNGPIEYSFDIVARVIESGSSAFPTLVSNTEAGIKKTNTNQITSSISASQSDIQIISASFGNVINIVSNGTGSIPTITQNTERGVLISTGSQITSSLTPNDEEVEKVTTGFDIVLDIIENGTGSIPPIQTNASGLVKRSNQTQYITSASIFNSTINFVTSSYNIVTDIVENGTGSLPTLVRNTEGLIKVSDITPITSSNVYGRSLRNGVSASYNTVLNIIENGTGSLPTYIFNTEANIKVTDTPQYISASSATTTESNIISASFSIVYNIIQNGTGSLPTLVENTSASIKVSSTEQFTGSLSGSLEDVSFVSASFSNVTHIIKNGFASAPAIQLYVTQSTTPSTVAAYEILKENIDFIQDETIAYLSSSWSTASYDEAKCRRDVGFIVSASAEDLLWGAQSASIVAGKFYWEYPSQAETSQINQTLDGIIYAGKLAQKLVQNIEFVTASENTTLGWELLRNNREFIEDETVAYISSSWSTHDYNEDTCKRDVTHIIDAVSTDLLYGGNERSINAGEFYYLYPSQATGSQLDETLDGVRFASALSQKVVRNIVYVSQSLERINAYQLIFQNKEFIQEETIAYLSASWSEHPYNQETCKRDVGFIIDAVGTDLIYGGNERSITAGVYYYLYPSNATESELEPTLTGIRYARNLSDRLLRGGSFQTPTQEKLNAYELLFGNKEFVKDEVISYISASWDGFQYNQETCKRDVGYIIDAVATDTLYGGNERSIEAGIFYYKYPSTATTAQLDPTITGIEHARNLSVELLQNRVFQSASLSQIRAYNLLLENKDLIQTETILYVNSAWSFFNYDEIKCRRDVGYIVDAVATDILYGGNERSAIAGEFYYKYPSLATVNNNQTGQLDETLDGVRYSKGIAEKIIQNILLETPTESQTAGYELLIQNKPFIQNEVIAFVSSSWSGVDGFFYNEASCSRDIAYITDAVATDLIYGGNERSSKAGEYYFLYPSRATVAGYASPDAQLDQTTTGIRFGSGIAQKIVNNTLLQFAAARQIDAYNLLLENKSFIQDETIQFIDAFFPFLVYNRTKCRRDVGYITDAVATDLLYGGNERAITAGDYYYRFPSKATTTEQVAETVAGVDYAKEVAKKIVSNILLPQPTFVSNSDGNIKTTNLIQYTSSISATTQQINKVNSSFEIVTDTIQAGVESFTPTNATYNPANGEFVITIPNHTLKVSNFIYLKAESFVFTCTMDGNRTEHALPSIGQPAYNNKLEIQSVTQNTITVNVGKSGPNVEFNPTSASYNPATGDFVVTVGTHSLSVGEGIVMKPESFAFTCEMDDNQSVKSYPRVGIDPKAVRSIPLTAVTDTTLTFNVGVSGPNKYFTPISASYNALSGDMTLTVSESFGLGVGRSVVLENESFAFTCDQDGNATTHSYPRPGSDPYAGKSIVITSVGTTTHTVTDAPYDSATGDVTITIASHGFSNGDYIKLDDNSLTYTCVLDGNTTTKSYPRPNYDYPSGRWLEISNVTTNTFDINIGSSPYVGAHTFVSATADGLERQDGTFTINVGNAGSASGSLHTFVSASNNAVKHEPQSVHTFVSASNGAVKHLPQAGHTFVRTAKNSVSTLPTIVSNNQGRIKVTDLTPETSSISAGPSERAKVSASFGLVRDIVIGGLNGIPDALAKNFDYGFSNEVPTLLHIAGGTQITGSGLFTSASLTTQTTDVSSSYGTIIDIIANGLDALPTLVTNSSSSLKVTNETIYSSLISGGQSEANKVLSGFNIVLDVVENGVGVIPRLVPNTSASVKVTDTPQFISSSSADRIQARIISASFSTVIDILQTGESPQIILSGSTPSSNTKINVAYDLLLNNKEMIIDETIQFMSSSWSEFYYNEESCSRDLGFIIDGAAKDLLYGGNEESVRNGEFYFLFPSEATGSQLDQTITAIKYASGLSQKVVRNQVLVHISSSQFVSASYNLLVNNKPFIQAEAIAYVSSSWSEFEYNEASCSRDVGYIVDAVATDLLYGGNERSIIAGRYYYDFPSQATDAQLEPTLTGIRYARGIAMELVKGTEFQTSSADTEYAYDLLTANKSFIQSESVAFVDVKYPHLQYDRDKCFRDTGYIVDAVATDLLYGGNEQSSKAGEFYYLFPSLATGVQLDETIEAVKYGSRLAIATINSEVVPSPEFIPNTSASIKVTNEAQTLGTGSTNQSVLNDLSSSFGIVMDIIINGTGSIPSLSPYGAPSSDTDINNVYNLVQNNLDFIKSETIAYISSSWSEFPYNEASCSRDVGLIVSGAIEDLLHNSVSASYVNGYYYYLFPSEATGSQLQQTLDGIRYAARITDKIAQGVEFVTASEVVETSYNLLRDNKEFIVSESIQFVSSSWSGFFYDQDTCGRDVRYIIDAVSTDLLYGGNERSKIAGEYYFLYPSTATSTQLDPTTTAIDYASGLAVEVIQNSQFVTASQILSASVDLIRNNRGFIQAETIAYVSASWANFLYNEDSCSRDVGYIVDAVTTDLLYGGNQRSVTAGKFYYLFPSEATTTQLNQTLDGVRWASRITQKLVQNIEFVTASQEVSASFDLLRQNKAFIQAETIAYVSSSWSGVYYNEASCSRDVGYIIDAVATDLLYGGTERSITAGSYYYLYPSRATNAGVPSEQNQLDATTTGIKYAGRLSKRVVTNPTFVLPSGSALVGRELLMLNKEFIQKETITFLSSSWSTLQYNEVSCSRDLGFILDAVATDMVYGGNERSVTAGTFYYLIPSVAIKDSYTDNGTVGQKKQTVDGINYAGGVSRKVVNKNQMVPPTQRNREAYDRLLASREDLKERALGYTNGAFPYLVYNEASCSRDTGLILDAVATDLLYGGNERAIEAASSYFNGQYGSAEEVVLRQRTETLETNRYLRTLAQNIAANPPLENFGSLIVATGIDFSYNGAGVTFKALPPNQGGTGVADPTKEITELAGGRIFFTSGNESGDFRIGTGLTINQATGTLVGRTFSKSLFSLVTPFSLALEG